MRQIQHADCFARCVLNVEECLFEEQPQKPTAISGAKSMVTPDMTMTLSRNDSPMAYFEHKAIFAQFYHAMELEQTTSATYSKTWGKAVQGIYKQVIIRAFLQ